MAMQPVPEIASDNGRSGILRFLFGPPRERVVQRDGRLYAPAGYAVELLAASVLHSLSDALKEQQDGVFAFRLDDAVRPKVKALLAISRVTDLNEEVVVPSYGLPRGIPVRQSDQW